MKKTKKIWLGLLTGLGISSLIAVGCGLAFSNSKIVNTNITASNSNLTTNNQSTPSSLSSKTSNVTANSTNVISSQSSASVSNDKVSSQTNINGSENNVNDISNSANLPYHTLDTSTLVSENNNTFTYQCSNGNTLLLSINSANENTVSVLGFSGKEQSANLIIPSTVINGNTFYAVTSIASGAFYGQQLNSVTFNNNLLSIGALAFANNNLSSLSFPSSLQSIGDKAFIGNQFPHAYAVYLPNNTTWSKNWLSCPFSNKNNLSKLVNGIQFVIQGSAVYEYEPNQNGWIIVSYNVTTSATNNPDWTTSTGTWSQDTYTNTTQATPNFSAAKNVSVSLATSFNGNLSNFALYTITESSTLGWLFYFDPTTKTFNVEIPVNSESTFNPLFGNNVSTTLSISLFDPYSGQYIINWQNIPAYSIFPPGANSLSFPYQDGDILTYSISDSQHGAWAYIASNFNQDLLNNNSFLFSSNPTNYLNEYIDTTYAWTSQKGLTNSFAIKPNGIYPTNLTTSLSNVSYNPTSGLLDLVGTSLPNMKYGVYYDNNEVGTFDTNNEGNINASINITKNLTDSNNITIQALSATNNNTNVVYPSPYTTHLQGFNPKESFLQLSLDGTSTKILFNGFTNTLAVADINTTWPAYATNDGNYSADTLSSSSTFSDSGTLTVDITNASGSAINTTPFTYTKGEDVSKLYTYLESLPYENGYTYTFVGTNYSFGSVFDNGTVVAYGSSNINGTTQSSFVINTNGITCTTNQTIHDSYLGAINECYGSGANSRRWSATYGWLACSSGDTFTTDSNHSNWYNPNQYMVEVAHQIAASYSNPIDIVMALFDWTHANISYNLPPEGYYEPVRGYFQHLEGVCANISDVFGALLKIDGFVSCQVWGSIDPITLNLVQSQMLQMLHNDVGHQWTQVWIPSLQEWITLDPTWNWALPFGDVESQFNTQRCDMTINVVEWPENATGLYYDSYGTLSYHSYSYDNYFSYFKGCEYQALLNLGRDFDILPGMYQNTYQYAYAQAMANIINWAANPSNSMVNNNYVLDTMYTK